MNEKVALISGGTSGIGLETARVLLAVGWSVAAGRNGTGLFKRFGQSRFY